MLDFNQFEQRTYRVLPPSSFENADEQTAEDIKAAYDRIGSSFKSAKWGPDRKVIFAVMRREMDEVFVINYMEAIGGGPAGPVAMIAGTDIQFDVAPDGTAVVSIQGFEYVDDATIPPEFIKDGRVYKPYRSSLLMVKISEVDGRPEVTPLFSDSPDLGFLPGPLNDDEREKHNVPAGIDGIVAEEVAPKTASDLIGIAPGDVLVSINDIPIDEIDKMYEILTGVLFGERVKIDWYAGSDDVPGMRSITYVFGSEDGMALRSPAVSPDSTMVAVVVGKTASAYSFESRELVILPMSAAGISLRHILINPLSATSDALDFRMATPKRPFPFILTSSSNCITPKTAERWRIRPSSTLAVVWWRMMVA